MMIQAQEEFSFELYFEDGLGNKDTLILGYDQNATDSIDVMFGEVNIKNQPWNGILEVRTFENYFVPDTALFKKDIRTYYSNFPILMNFQEDSIKLSWNETVFIDTIQGSSISNDLSSLAYFSVQDSIWINKNQMLYNITGTDTLYRLFIDFDQQFADISKGNFKTIKLFPNPSSGIINLDFKEIEMNEVLVSVFDLTGRTVYHTRLNDSKQIDLSHLENGTYSILFFKNEYYLHTQNVVIWK